MRVFLKQKLLVVPIIIGLLLLVISWFLSYPLSFDSPLDFVFNHISPLYWIGLLLFLVSLYLAATSTKNRKLILVACILIVTAIYGLRYFYYWLPSSDALYVRGLTEYALTTGDLNASKPYHSYFQWPSLFTLSQMSIPITGLQLMNFEFILFATLGALYSTCLYIYASRFSENGSYIAVIAYFVMMYWFLNYQFAPFSLAMGLLFVLFTIETSGFKGRNATLLTSIIFMGVTLTHPFAAVLFIAYALVMYVLSRSAHYLRLLLLTVIVYLLVTISLTPAFFAFAIRQVASIYSSEYQTTIARTFSGRLAPSPVIDAVAESFSRAIVLSTGAVAVLGFLLLFWRRKLRTLDLAIFISAGAYALAGVVLPVLGIRAWFALFIPISLGVTYFATGKYGKYLKCFFLIALVLVPFIPLTDSFTDTQVFFQTKSEYNCANFAVNDYNWTKQSSFLSSYRVMTYLSTRTAASGTHFGTDLTPDFPGSAGNYDCIMYTIGLGTNLLPYNYSLSSLFQKEKYNIIFDAGSCYVAVKASREGS